MGIKLNKFKMLQILTSKQMGHFLDPVSLSWPQSCNPWT